MKTPLLFARAFAVLLIGAIVAPTLPAQARPYTAPVHRPAPLVQSADRVVPDESSTSVDKDGNFHVSIPIEVPPGIDGAQPGLSLEYDSAQSNGVSGVGWQLAGISAITRCPQIPAIDGVRGTITFTRSDRFCLDGARLIATSGEYGAPGSAYQTEIQTWQYVVASTQMCGSGPCSFTVTQRDGSVVTYGADENSREMAGSLPEVRRWLARSVRGTNGNTILYTYTTGAPNLNRDIARIDYGSNADVAGTQSNRSVRFIYDGERPDPIVQYVGGISYSEPRLLRAVATYVNETPVAQTKLTYRTSASSGRSLLASVQRCGADACSRASEISWSGEHATFRPVTLAFSTPQPNTSNVSPVDVNGDGRADLSLATNAGSATHLVSAVSNGSDRFVTCTAAQVAHQPGERFFSGDVSADGRADTVQVFDTNNRVGVQLYRNTGNGCRLDAEPLQIFNLPSKPDYAWLADVRGNGRSDLVLAWKAPTGLTVATMLSEGNRFGEPRIQTLPLDPSPVAMFFADVNGDGMVDLVQITRDRRGTALVSTALANGSGFAAPISTQTDAPVVDVIGAWPLDLNHDGLTDVVIASRAADHTLRMQPIFATGLGAFVAGDLERSNSPASSSRYVGPIDTSSSGAPAIVNVYAFGNTIRVDTFTVTEGRIGDPVSAVSSFSPDVESRIMPLDFVGSGAPSLVQLYPDRGREALSGMRSTVSAPDVITAFTNPIGGVTRVHYAPLSDPNVYTPRQTQTTEGSDALDYAYRMTPGQGPYQRVGGGVRPVVAELLHENDHARNASTYRYLSTFHYADGLFTYDGRGWLGFKTMESTDRGTGAVALQTYHQAWPLTGLVSREEAHCTPGIRSCTAAGALLSRTDNTYEVAESARASSGGGRVVDPHVSAIETSQYQGGTLDVRRSRTFAYDAYGNVTKLDSVGAFDASGTRLGGPSVLTCSTYQNDVRPDGWMLGLMRTRKVTTAATCGAPEAFDAGALHLERFTYDTRGNQLTDGIYDNTNDAWLTTSYAYDTFGNQTRIVQPGGGTTDVAYESSFNTYPEREVSPANAQGARATTTFGYDPRFGVEAARRDPNGAISVACVDEFGFVAAEQGPIPQQPANVRSSQNCAGTLTGDASAYRAARVITLQTFARGEDAQQRYVEESDTLDAWPTGDEAPRFVWRREYVDGLGRDYQQLSEDGNNGPGTIVCSNFDSGGQAERTSLPAFLGTQTCTSSSGNGFTWTTESFDAAGRPLELVQPLDVTDRDPSVTRFAYRPGLVTAITKAAGTPAQMRTVISSGYYDDQSKVTSLTLPDQHDARTTFAYDADGAFASALEPRTTNNPDGIATTVTYDSVGRRTSVNDPDRNSNPDPTARALRMYYGADGLLARTLDARGDRIDYARDPRGRIIRKTGTFATGARDTEVAYTYDDPAVNGVGALTKTVADGAHGRIYEQRFAYDVYGNVNASRFAYGDGGAYTQTKLYDPRSRAVETVEPDGSVVTHRYAYGQLAAIGLGNDPLVRFAARTPLGLAGRIDYGTSASSSVTYLAVGLPSRERVTASGGNTVLDSSLSWDRLFNVHAVIDELKAGGVDRSERFSYEQSRLTGANAPGLYGSRDYAYDPSGLRVRDGDLVGHFHAHRLESLTRNGSVVVSAAYDFSGNMTRRSDAHGVTTLAYDTEDRLTESADGTGPVETYAYDDGGRRIEKREANGIVTRYPFAGVEIEAMPGHTAMSTIYLADDKGATYAAVSRGGDLATAPVASAPQVRYIHANQVGSTSVVLDGEGRLEARLAYEPYGSASAGSTGSTPLTKRFQAHELDASRHLYYFGARYYDPGLGNFITADSQLGSDLYSQDALNRYEFALANPETLVDVTGHGIFDAIVGFIIGAVEIVAGIAVDILSDGALEPLGQGLVGAGINGITYSLEAGSDFSWESYGDQQAVGFVLGAVTAGVGELATSAAEAAADVAGSAVADVAEDTAESLAVDASGDAVESESEDALSSMASEAERGEAIGDEESAALDSEAEDETCTVSSFTAGTPVLTPQGARAIQTLRAGDLVLSRNAIDGSVSARRITQTLAHPTSDIIALTFVGSPKALDVTREHAFALADGRWVPASSLVAGERVARDDGTSATVASARAMHLVLPRTMYNLAVAGSHSYFVGKLGVWVHNPCNVRRGKGKIKGKSYDITLEMSESEYPESAKHIKDAQKNGFARVLTISRKGAKSRRRLALRGIKTRRGFDRDEYPPAMFKEGGNSSVRLITSWDNRASGSSFGGQLRGFTDGTRVWFKIVP